MGRTVRPNRGLWNAGQDALILNEGDRRMITLERTTSDNRHIKSLQSLLENSPTPINWLVIAHNDHQMIDSLSSALSGESAAILRIPQDPWDFAEEELLELIEWALQQGELKHLVLLGHSNATETPVAVSLASPLPEGDCDPAEHEIGNRLLDGVRRSTARTQQARKMFADKMQQLSEIPVIHNRWTNDELSLYGLFYQGDSGVFLAYDLEQKNFHPLLH